MKACFKKINLLVAYLLIFIPILSFANQSITPRLLMTSLVQKASQEENDELYFLVADLNAPDKQFYTVPGYYAYRARRELPRHSGFSAHVVPAHWRAKQLNTLRNVLVWQRKLSANQGTQLILSLVEADLPPFDLDDSLGAVRLEVINKSGHLLATLKSHNSDVRLITQKKIGKGYKYVLQFSGDKAAYVMTLRLLSS